MNVKMIDLARNELHLINHLFGSYSWLLNKSNI